MPGDERAPDSPPTVIPRLFVDDRAGLVAFLRTVFGAEGDAPADRPAWLTIGDSALMVSGTEFRGPFPGFLYVYVEDTDATYTRALAAGASTIEAPTDVPYGDRRATISDPWENVWQIATHPGPNRAHTARA